MLGQTELMHALLQLLIQRIADSLGQLDSGARHSAVLQQTCLGLVCASVYMSCELHNCTGLESSFSNDKLMGPMCCRSAAYKPTLQ